MFLGLDFGSQTGVALGEPDAHPICRTWQLPTCGGADVGPFMLALATRLGEVLAGGQVTHACFEAPYTPLHMAGGRAIPMVNQIRRNYGSAAVCEMLCAKYGVRVIEIAPTSLKKSFTGNGRSDKAAMLRTARARGFTATTEHEADAAACWYHLISIHARQRLPVFDPINAQARLAGRE